MVAEHTQSADSNINYTTGNYGVTTTSHIECMPHSATTESLPYPIHSP